MQGISKAESEALDYARKELGTYVTPLGDKPLFSYTKDEIEGMIQNIILSYQTKLQGVLDDEIPF